MKKQLFLILMLIFVANIFADDLEDVNAEVDEMLASDDNSSNSKEDKFSGSIVAGAVTIDGQNYQQIGFRADIPIWKFGLGADIQILLDDEGNIRKEDWDEASDYADKIYYLRFAHKGDPFYIKVGGLDYSSLGYGIIVNGYSNMIEYPDYKRIGMETSFETETFGGELFVNNFKELFQDKAGMLAGGRLFYKVAGKLIIGVTAVSDLNEYNGLRDKDDDGYVDQIDLYPNKGKYVTDYDYYSQISSVGIADSLVQYGVIDSLKKDDLIKYSEKSSSTAIVGLDVGYPLITGKTFSLDVYGQAAKILDYGWGFAAPGFRMNAGPFTINAEYRHSAEKFMFGYYNSTYELQRSVFVTDTNGNMVVKTKQEMLKDLEGMNGYYAGVSFNAWGFVVLTVNYQNLFGENFDNKSIYGEISLKEKLIPKISEAKGYYIQNDVQDFSNWKTPSTIMGYKVGWGLSEGVNLNFDYRTTFQDRNGDGDVNDDKESIKSVQITTTVTF